MSDGLLAVLVASGLGAGAHAVGILLVQTHHDWTRRNAMPMTAFAGGVVVATALIHLLPEAAERIPMAAAWAILPFLALFILESHFVGHVLHHHPPPAHEEDQERRHAGHPDHPPVHMDEAAEAFGFLRPSIGVMTVVGFTVHTIFDGLAIGAGFHEGLRLGITSTFAVLAHELPEGIATYALVAGSGFSRRTALTAAWGIAAIDPVVAVTSFLLLRGIVSPALIGMLFALVAGSFLYIGASDLLPEVGRRASLRNTMLILAGILLVFVARFALH